MRFQLLPHPAAGLMTSFIVIETEQDGVELRRLLQHLQYRLNGCATAGYIAVPLPILRINDFNKVMDAIRYLREKELSTVQSLDAYLDTVSGQAVSIRAEMKPKEQRMKEINTLLSHIANFEAHKPVHVEYAAIRFKKPREQFAAAHRDELDAYNAAIRYFKVHLKEKKYSIKKLNEEQTQLAGEVAGYKERLSALQEDVKILRDVRHWLNQVLPSEQYRQTAEPGKKPSIQQAVKGRTQRIREEQAEKRKQPRTEKKQDMEL